MDGIAFIIWLSLGFFFMVSEFLVPGLVMTFVGLGALTVALGMYLGYIDSLVQQFLIFFISSIIYLLPLRFLVISFVPTNRRKVNIDEDKEVIGKIVEIISDINSNEFGRIEHGGSSWKARSDGGQTILKGEQAKIVGRENITWIVKKV